MDEAHRILRVGEHLADLERLALLLPDCVVRARSRRGRRAGHADEVGEDGAELGVAGFEHRGFGFIRGEDGREYFFHCSECAPGVEFATLAPDEPEYHNNRGLALAALQRDGAR